MNLTALNTFLAIVETGSLVRASAKLNVTQSTVTARLKLLEDDLGQTLITRQKSGAKLTAPGYKFLRYAEIMTGLWQQARQETSLPEGIETLCNIGCHMDLWPGLGQLLFNEIHRNRTDTALTVWPGEQSELDRWFGTGLVDTALAYQPVAHANQTIYALKPDRLVLYSTRADSPMRFDPLYVFVDFGADFRRQHAEAYADAGVARTSFGSAVWALDHLLQNGGSAYLPERLGEPGRAEGLLYVINEAPVFARNVYLITNDLAVENWAWLPSLVERLSNRVSET